MVLGKSKMIVIICLVWQVSTLTSEQHKLLSQNHELEGALSELKQKLGKSTISWDVFI